MAKVFTFAEVVNEDNDLYNEPVLSQETIGKHMTLIDVSKTDRIRETGLYTRGHQNKWVVGDTYVKMDTLGYESYAEIMACWLMDNIENLKVDFVRYYPCCIAEDGKPIGYGCYCENFLGAQEQEIQLGKILKQYNMDMHIYYDDLIKIIKDKCNLDISDYVLQTLQIDALTRNSDRHLYNMSIIRRNIDESFRLGYIYDNGDGFLSNMVKYPKNQGWQEQYAGVQSKPFKTDFTLPVEGYEPLKIKYWVFRNSIDDVGSEQLNKALWVVDRALKETEGNIWLHV